MSAGEAKEIVKVMFYDSEIDCVKEGDTIWVSVRRVCESLGIASNRQIDKLRNKTWACGNMMLSHDASGRNQEQFFVDLDTVPMWLATIDENRVKPEIRPLLQKYQLECKKVLYDYFFGKHQGPQLAVADQVALGKLEVEKMKVQVLLVNAESRKGEVEIRGRREERLDRKDKANAYKDAARGMWKSGLITESEYYQFRIHASEQVVGGRIEKMFGNKEGGSWKRAADLERKWGVSQITIGRIAKSIGLQRNDPALSRLVVARRKNTTGSTTTWEYSLRAQMMIRDELKTRGELEKLEKRRKERDQLILPIRPVLTGVE